MSQSYTKPVLLLDDLSGHEGAILLSLRSDGVLLLIRRNSWILDCPVTM